MIPKNIEKIKFTRSIGFKMAVVLTVVLFIIISIFSHLNVKLTEKKIMKIAVDSATNNSASIKNALEQAMLSGNKQLIQNIISIIGSDPSIEDIKIVDATGNIKWAKNPSERGQMLDRTKIKSCMICHKVEKPSREPLSIVFEKDTGKRVLRNVTPIDNKPACYSCHPAGIKVIGKLLVDYSVKEMDKMVADNKRLLLSSAIATSFGAVIISIMFFNRMVGSPLKRLFKKIKEVASGNLDALVEVKGNDEIALLGAFFNDMVHGIKTYIKMIEKEHIEERLTLASVADILNKSQSTEEAVNLILNTLNIGFGVEKSAILYINYDGRIAIKGTIGLTEEEVDIFKNYLEVAFSIDNHYAFGSSMTDAGYEVSRIKEMISNGEIFVAAGSKSIIDNFLVVPLKAAGELKGAIIVSKIKDIDIASDRAKEIFSIIASSIAPHFYIGLCADEKRQMKSGPFESFMELIKSHINRVKQYEGSLSMGIIKLKNYEQLYKNLGAEKTCEWIRDIGVSISDSIDKVHDAVRISGNTIILLLPMMDKTEALETIQKAISSVQINNIVPEITVIAYPEDGQTAEQLICSVQEV